MSSQIAVRSGGRRGLGVWCAVVLLATAVAQQVAQAGDGGARVGVVYGPSQTYEAGARTLVTQLSSAGHVCESIQLPLGDEEAMKAALARVVAFEPTVIAAGGTVAALHALEAVDDVPVVYFMVPNALDAPFVAAHHPDHDRVCGVAADVDPADQLAWARRTCPDIKKIGVLCSERTRETARALERAGRKRGIEVVSIPAEADDFVAAVRRLEQAGCGGVIMIPDATIYNSVTVRRLLVWGARQRKPVWTFSRNVVKAGALGGLYCDGSHVGRQAAGVVCRLAGGRAPATVGLCYPSEVSRVVNLHTAEIIGAQAEVKELPRDVERVGE